MITNVYTPVSSCSSQAKENPTPLRRKTGDADDDAKDDDVIVVAASLGLNHIRTRSAPMASNLRMSGKTGKSNLGNKTNVAGDRNVSGTTTSYHHSAPLEQGKKLQTKSLRGLPLFNQVPEGHHTAFAKEIQSPRFQAILRATSGIRKKVPDIKSFPHELNSKGVRPFPYWKSRAFGGMKEIMLMIRAKFDKLKEEVDCDLGIFAGDMVGILEKSSELHPEWTESLEYLLVTARFCAKMTPNEFWLKCEGIVQNLDDRRQELPMGPLKQVYTRLLFILTRCSRLVQFRKESGFEEDHAVGLHQLSDLGAYPEQIVGSPRVKEETEKQKKTDETIFDDKQNYGLVCLFLFLSMFIILLHNWHHLPF